MKGMFIECHKLKQIIGIDKFNTMKVTNMQGMFQRCRVLESLDLTNFNTINVTNMSFMFNYCCKIKQIIGINKLNTIKVNNFSCMFQRCYELESLDLSSFNANNVNNMRGMFNKCQKLKEIIGIGKFDTSKVYSMFGIFNECNELKYLDLSNFNTANDVSFCIMFQECFELTYVDISNFNFQNVKDIRWMFNKCYRLKEIKGINIINNIQNLNKIGIFDDCPKLKNISNYEHKKTNNIIKQQINIKFTSCDQKILNYTVTCYNTDIFENVFEKVYLKYPEFNDKEIYCLYGGTIINERVSLVENKIVDGSTILIDYS